MVTTVAALRRQTAQKLEKAGVWRPKFEADIMLRHVLGFGQTDLLTHGADSVGEDAEKLLLLILKRRLSGEPLQYILGRWEFYSLPFAVGEGVLIPRADTELLVDTALRRLNGLSSPRVLDLCSGSGCVAVAIAHRRPDARVTAVELYDPAIGYLTENIRLNGVQVEIRRADVLKPPDKFGEYDLIVSNPPYIESGEIASLMREVAHEPVTALDGGDDGLKFYRSIAENWLPLLAPDGAVAVEIGAAQGDRVSKIFASAGFKTKVINDFSDNQRVIFGTRDFVE
jgi:release factor glutamine methyltransferase